jgi:hypothetical protein
MSNKKQTLEEYIKEVTKNFDDEMSVKFTSGGIKLGAKWQAERMYSEEQVHNLLDTLLEGDMCSVAGDELIEQFKHKITNNLLI